MKRRNFLKTSTAMAASWVALPGCNSQAQQDSDAAQSSEQDRIESDQSTGDAMAESLTGQMPDYSTTGVELITDSTPALDGFYFPGEWEPHEYTIMPPPQNWEGFGFKAADVRQQWADVANALADYERVLMVVTPEDKKHAVELLNGEIELVEFPLNDGWSRDSGPIFVVNGNGERRAIGPTFNGWGEKMEGMFRKDEIVKASLCAHLGVPMYPVDVCFEGGAVALDGDGTLITTEQCLMNPNRNPNLSREMIDQRFCDAFGCEKVIWFGKGLEPDPITDGHVDGMLAYIDSGTVLLSSCDDEDDPNFEICADAKRRLQETTDAKGREIEIIDLPATPDGGHMNFYIANGCVLVPTTEDPDQDDEPMAIIREMFDDRDVIGIGGEVLSEGGGGIHCITQQVPVV